MNVALAERAGPSPSSCLRRVQELTRRGVIRGSRAALELAETGVGLLGLPDGGAQPSHQEAQAAFEREITRAPEVRECHNVTGGVEYLLRVEAADLAAYKRFHSDVVGTLPQVQSLTTYVVMASPKDERA